MSRNLFQLLFLLWVSSTRSELMTFSPLSPPASDSRGMRLCATLIFFLFFQGCAISWNGEFKKYVKGQSFAAVIEYILNCGCFFYIGAWLPWKDFSSPSIGISPWRLVVFSISILFLRRFPAILALYKCVPQIKNWKQALLCGHFGS